MTHVRRWPGSDGGGILIRKIRWGSPALRMVSFKRCGGRDALVDNGAGATGVKIITVEPGILVHAFAPVLANISMHV